MIRRLLNIMMLALVAIPAMAFGSESSPQLPKVIASYPTTTRPALVTPTSNASVFWGGRTGRTVVPANQKHSLGHLRWLTYTVHSATATGVEWTREGPVTKAFVIDGNVKLQLSRPRQGIFTRLRVTTHFNGNAYAHERFKTSSYVLKAADGLWCDDC